MYKLNELNEMSDGQLRELAKSMGIKRVDSTDHEALVYQVLDHQAETEAANTPEQGKRRRERIRQPAAKANGNEVTKDDAVANKQQNKTKNINNDKDKQEKPMTDSSLDSKVESANQETTVDTPKRKRGRPSAAEKAAREATQIQNVTPDIIAVNEQPVNDQPVEDAVKETTQRRRGRKPKQAVETPVLPFDNMEQQETELQPDMPVGQPQEIINVTTVEDQRMPREQRR